MTDAVIAAITRPGSGRVREVLGANIASGEVVRVAAGGCVGWRGELVVEVQDGSAAPDGEC